jgi:CheY-like chemotaxis protein
MTPRRNYTKKDRKHSMSTKPLQILVLDDDDVRHERFSFYLSKEHNVTHVHTFQGAIDALLNGVFDVVFLDHDLNDHHYRSVTKGGSWSIDKHLLTGYDVCVFLTKVLAKEARPKLAIVHSWNPPGAEAMMHVLKEGEIRAIRWLFISTQDPSDVIPKDMYEAARDE